jgi:DNA repair protein RecN (Recombination protein N)
MLQHLTIKNFALIDEYEICFEPFMSVVTGETGTGKSILIDALSLSLGARADSKMIRHGANRCDVTAEFLIDHLAAVNEWLAEQDLAQNQDCILRRAITLDGKSRAFINGQPVTLQQLSQLGELLVNIHGQHEHHFLLKKEHQLLLLDEFGRHQPLLEKIKKLFLEWQRLAKEKQQLQQLQQNDQQYDFIHFQLQELTDLALAPEEFQRLEAEHKTLCQAENILLRSQNSLNNLSENDLNIIAQLQLVQQQLGPIQSISESILNAHNNLSQAQLLIDEAVLDLRHYLSSFDLSPERLITISNRLDQIHRIAKKHRVKPEELCGKEIELKKLLDDLSHADEQLKHLAQQQKEVLERYHVFAEQLTKKRLAAGKTLSRAITQQMQKLAMTGGAFEIQFQPHHDVIHAKGQERCEFWVSPNPGQVAQPLGKIASGGELSRISLAIQVIFASGRVVPTLIFDEVDVGIGGATAMVVGQLLQQLGQHVQVLCVTHLPQVAVFAKQHYQVEKNIVDNQTYTSLKRLTHQDRQEEIARMLGGMTISPQSLAHAKELMDQAEP